MRTARGMGHGAWGMKADCWAYDVPVLAIIKVYASVLDLIKNKKNENAKLFDCQMRARLA